MRCLGTSGTARVRSRLRESPVEGVLSPLRASRVPVCTHCAVLAARGARGRPGRQPCWATVALMEPRGGGPQRVGACGGKASPHDQQDRATSAPGQGNR